MMEHNDELYLKQKVGNRNPFRVPENYFEQLAEQVMQNLSDVARQEPITQSANQPRARKLQIRPWLYAAACSVVALAMGVSYYFMNSQATSTEAAPMASVAPAHNTASDMSDLRSDNSYYDDAADYAMLDNAEIYAYLSENY